MTDLITFRAEQLLPVPRRELFSFFENHENLARLTPSSLKLRIVSSDSDTLRLHARFRYTVNVLGIPVPWTTLITRCEPPVLFEDVQLSGPYAEWRHLHEFMETSDGTLMTDSVSYRLPFGWIGNVAGRRFARHQLNEVFNYRGEVLRKLFGTM